MGPLRRSAVRHFLCVLLSFSIEDRERQDRSAGCDLVFRQVSGFEDVRDFRGLGQHREHFAYDFERDGHGVEVALCERNLTMPAFYEFMKFWNL